MTYDSPLWASEGEVIPEVASFKEEGLVTPEGSEGEKQSWKFVGPWRELNPGHLLTTTPSRHCYKLESIRVLWNKNSPFTNPSLTQIETIDIGHKSLPIIIGP